MNSALLGLVSAVAGGLVVSAANYAFEQMRYKNQHLSEMRTKVYLDYLDIEESNGVIFERLSKYKEICKDVCTPKDKDVLVDLEQRLDNNHIRQHFNRNQVILYASSHTVGRVARYHAAKDRSAMTLPDEVTDTSKRDAYVDMIFAMRQDIIPEEPISELSNDIISVLCPWSGDKCFGTLHIGHLSHYSEHEGISRSSHEGP